MTTQDHVLTSENWALTSETFCQMNPDKFRVYLRNAEKSLLLPTPSPPHLSLVFARSLPLPLSLSFSPSPPHPLRSLRPSLFLSLSVSLSNP